MNRKEQPTANKMIIDNCKLLIAIFSFFIATTATPLAAQQFTIHCNGENIPANGGNNSHFGVVLDCPYAEVADTSDLPKGLLKATRKYLLKRVGPTFYKRLVYYSSQTIGDERRESCTPGAKYAVQYMFADADSMEFYVTMLFDKDLKVLSKPFLPDVKKNPKFGKYIGFCEAYKKVQADTLPDVQLSYLTLEYSPKLNSFVWVARKDDTYIIINAQTGNVIRRKNTDGSKMVDFD